MDLDFHLQCTTGSSSKKMSSLFNVRRMYTTENQYLGERATKTIYLLDSLGIINTVFIRSDADNWTCNGTEELTISQTRGKLNGLPYFLCSSIFVFSNRPLYISSSFHSLVNRAKKGPGILRRGDSNGPAMKYANIQAKNRSRTRAIFGKEIDSGELLLSFAMKEKMFLCWERVVIIITRLWVFWSYTTSSRGYATASACGMGYECGGLGKQLENTWATILNLPLPRMQSSLRRRIANSKRTWLFASIASVRASKVTVFTIPSSR